MGKPDVNEMIKRFEASHRRCILLDYDGTLVNFTAVPETKRLSEDISEVLHKLTYKPDTQVYIITGRSYRDAVEIFAHVSAVIIAEHGSVIRENFTWRSMLNDQNPWKEQVLRVLAHATAQCPGSFIEEKSFTLSWHYRNANALIANLVLRNLRDSLSVDVALYDLKIIEGNKVVEVMDNKVGKGLSVKRIYENEKPDFILSVGDDITDEEMFRYLSNVSGAFTVKVGDGDTCARYKLTGTIEVLNILKELAL